MRCVVSLRVSLQEKQREASQKATINSNRLRHAQGRATIECQDLHSLVEFAEGARMVGDNQLSVVYSERLIEHLVCEVISQEDLSLFA